MSKASDYLEPKILDHIVGKTSFTMPADVFIALCSDAIVDADTGGTITEVSYTGYARVECSDDWNAAAGPHPMTSSNANDITFGECTAGSGTANYWAACDALTVGNMLFYGSITTPLAISVGVTPKFTGGTPGELTVTMA